MAKEATIKININTKNAINSIDDLNNEFNGTLQTIGDLRIASQRLSEELESTPVGTAKFQELQQSLIDVNGQLKNYELSIEALDNEQLASEIRSVVGGVMDLAGGFVLLGASKDSKVMNSILTKSAVAQEVLATATAASGTASSGAALKFRALTAAMLSNPLTAIAVAITAVVSALILFGDESEEAEKKHKKFADSVAENTNKITKAVNASLKQLELQTKELEAQGASEAELLNKKLKNIDTEEDLTFKQYNVNLLRISKLSKKKDEETIAEVKRLEEQNKALDDKLTKDQYNLNEFDYRRKELDIDYVAFKTEKDKKLLEEQKKNATENLKIEQERIINLSKIYNEFSLEKEKVENEFLDTSLTNQQLEENSVRDKYFTLIEESKKYKGEDINLLKAAQQEELDLIDQKYKNIAKVEKGLTEKTNAEILQMEVEHQKELELLEANTIEDEETRQQTILNIKKKYLQLEIDAINNSTDKQKQALETQLKVTLTNDELTYEQKENLRAEYNRDIISLDQDRELKISQLESDSIESSIQKLQTKLDKYSNGITQIGSFVTQAADVIDQALQEKSDRELYRIRTENDNAKEQLKNRLDNGLIDREDYSKAIEVLDKQRESKEREIAKKSFQRQKAQQIINATIQTAQAVLAAYAAGAAVPIIGPITTGPAYAAIAGALGATQIGVIASQKFKASRGGKVPGQPSSVDSVDALLAPGETVINSRSSEMFAPLLSAINESGGGVSLAPTNGITQPKSTTIYSDNVGVGQQTVRAYVVEQDISYSQNRVGRLRDNARFS